MLNNPEIRRCSEGGREHLAASLHDALDAVAQLLADFPQLAPMFTMMNALAHNAAADNQSLVISGHSEIGYVYIGVLDMMQAAQKRAKL